jgi:hypothetical protein
MSPADASAPAEAPASPGDTPPLVALPPPDELPPDDALPTPPDDPLVPPLELLPLLEPPCSAPFPWPDGCGEVFVGLADELQAKPLAAVRQSRSERENQETPISPTLMAYGP